MTSGAQYEIISLLSHSNFHVVNTRDSVCPNFALISPASKKGKLHQSVIAGALSYNLTNNPHHPGMSVFNRQNFQCSLCGVNQEAGF